MERHSKIFAKARHIGSVSVFFLLLQKVVSCSVVKRNHDDVLACVCCQNARFFLTKDASPNTWVAMEAIGSPERTNGAIAEGTSPQAVHQGLPGWVMGLFGFSAAMF